MSYGGGLSEHQVYWAKCKHCKCWILIDEDGDIIIDATRVTCTNKDWHEEEDYNAKD